ncbi:hypothetical protein ABZT02_12470 [Streptomyces sp. NPDC005402]|uniref:hypothetical protein n=1 Tax=Streptomyces sp. NPDC005402 TaxID=3155338 RepID=UPI0033AD2C54
MDAEAEAGLDDLDVVSEPRPCVQQAVRYRTLNARHRDRIVRAWAAGDDAALNQAWVNDVVVDLGSQRGE